MYLRDLTMYADETIVDEFKGGFVQRFHRQSCCITELYCNLLRKGARLSGATKIQVECFNAASNTELSPEIVDRGEFILCRLPFQFRDYAHAPDTSKKVMLADALKNSLLHCAERRQWDTSAISHLDAVAREKSLLLTGESKASWLSPDGKHRARIAFEWHLDAIHLSATLFRNRSAKVLSRKTLGDAVPEIGQLHFVLSAENGQWISDVEFQVTTSDFIQKRWIVSFSDVII
jgi:hypothetical protein